MSRDDHEVNDPELEALFRKISAMGAAYRKAVAPIERVTRQVNQALGPVRRVEAQIQAAIRPYQEAMERAQQTFAPFVVHLHDLAVRIAPVAAELAEAIKQLPERQRTALLTMAKHGWYLDSEMPLPSMFKPADALNESESTREVERELTDYFETRIDSLLDEISEKFPSRETPLREALDAHRAGKYFLSTPVILSQADGICQDTLGVQLYRRRGGRSVLAHAFEGRSDEAILMSIIAPLLEPLPLTASSKERRGAEPVLNRHVVVHGESVTYGKREVSARAISFLAYVTWVLDYSTESLEEGLSENCEQPPNKALNADVE